MQVLPVFLLFFLLAACNHQSPATVAPEAVTTDTEEITERQPLRLGAQRTEVYFPLLKGKKIALTVNQTSTVGDTHLVDTLLAAGFAIEKIFAPEHGFRGTADAGEKVANGRDAQTDLPLISLYGERKKPLPADLAGIDLVVFDIQDVGARFYTYISTLTYLAEACAEQNIPLLVLDRPNPNGHYIDGPILQPEFSSFVGLHPVPVVHGMTVGEYARMVNGEGWLANGITCDLNVITCTGYDHDTRYELSIAPSPNLPNMRSIYLYPSLCFFEGTTVNIGRGTEKQFQVYGDPKYTDGSYTYTPVSRPGAKYPKHENEVCNGYNLSGINPAEIREKGKLELGYLLDFYTNYPDKESFFLKNNFFDKLAGTDALRKAIIAGKTEAEIRAEWQSGLEEYREMREKYVLY